MPITELLERNAQLYPNEIALTEINPDLQENRRLTWREYELVEPSRTPCYRREITWQVFNEKANRFANALLSRGIGKGDKVAILLMNCLEWLPIYFGILKTGAIVVPLNYRFSSDEIDYCLNLSQSDALIFGPEFIGRVEEIAEKISTNRLLMFCGVNCPTFADSYTEMTADCSSQNPGIPLTEEEYAAIYFSSGSTGFPKAILHRHRALSHAAVVEQKHHGQTHEDVFLCIPPLYHTGAKMHWFGSLISGSRAVILKGTKPNVILDAVSREKCSIVWLLVPWAQDILDAFDTHRLSPADYDLSAWRLMHIGASPVPQSLVRHWKDYFPNHDYDTNYGLSESIGPGCVHLGAANVHKIPAIGKAGYGWETKIVDSHDNEVGPHIVGELCVKGPGVMVCYYNDPEATAKCLKGDWLYTGDVAEQDEDGFIYLVDRAKDVIITGGENLYPVQIENFIRACPGVSDVAVIGVPDRRLGEIACAIIEAVPGMTLTQEAIQEFCLGMPRYKRPRKIILSAVPRNATGKIDKPALRKQYAGLRLVDAQNRS